MGDFFKNIGSVISSVSEALNSDSAKQVINAISGNADIATGLKTALKVGIEAAAKSLGQEDGYLADAAVRIGLPKELDLCLLFLSLIFQAQEMMDLHHNFLIHFYLQLFHHFHH